MPDWKLLPKWEEGREYMLSRPDELRKNLGDRIDTPFEHSMIGGSSPNWEYLAERGDTIDDMHTPIRVLGDGRSPEKNISIEEMNLIRTRVEFVTYAAFSLGLIYKRKNSEEDRSLKGKMLALSIEPLDPETGVTIRDPRILGVWDEENRKIVQLEGRDLNREWYQMQKDWAKDHPDDKDALWDYTRDGKSYLETESSGEPEKE